MTNDKSTTSDAPKLEEVAEEDLDQVQGGFKFAITDGTSNTLQQKVNVLGDLDQGVTDFKYSNIKPISKG